MTCVHSSRAARKSRTASWAAVETEEFLPLLEATFRDILTAQEVPAANEVQCGWGANHSLTAAQEAPVDRRLAHPVTLETSPTSPLGRYLSRNHSPALFRESQEEMSVSWAEDSS